MPLEKHVLIVEDHDDTRKSLKTLLHREGFAVSEANSIANAKTRQDFPSHVILDLRLPDGNGAEILGLIRANSPTTKVLVVTGESFGSRLHAQMRAAQPDAFLSKPFEMEAMLRWLRQ